MLIALSKYTKPEEVVSLIGEHKQFLAECYTRDQLIFSGPRTSKTGGVILAKLNSEEEFRNLLNQDPLVKKGVAEYDIIEFAIGKCDPNFECFNK